MKLVRHLTWQNMKSAKARTLVTILGIVLSAAMFTAVTTMGMSLRSYLLEAELAERGDYFLRYDYGTMEDLESLRRDPSVTQLGTLTAQGYAEISPEGDGIPTQIFASGDRNFFEMIPVNLLDGRLPENGSEIVISEQLQDLLKASGVPCAVGDPLALQVGTVYADTSLELPGSGIPFEGTYTICGISEGLLYLEDSSLGLGHILTFDDGTADGLWGRFYVKTQPRDALPLADAFGTGERTYGMGLSVNYNLLNLYGASKYNNINDMIAGFAVVLILIIMAGSVSLIYNAFSISVSERTRQFGLLSSVGATRRQIRQSVLTEALYLSAVGIPLGILSGYAGIAVTLHLTHGLVDDLLWTADAHDIILKAVPSWTAFLVAAVVALISVLISAWIPARRATKITPISAIRQTQEYQIPKHGIRAGKWSQKLFGLPAALARKYYTVNKRKYRATVVSLTISMVLFVCAGSFVQQLNAVAADQANTDNFDFDVLIQSQEELDKLRSHPAVRDSAIVVQDYANAVIPEDAFTSGYREAWNQSREFYRNDMTIGSKRVSIRYLEDDVLREFLHTQKLDPEPYLDSENPAALVPELHLTVYRGTEDARPTERVQLTEPILRDTVESLSLIPGEIPSEGLERFADYNGTYFRNIYALGDAFRQVLMVQQETADGDWEDVYFELEIRPLEDGTFGYYFVHPDTGLCEETPDAVTRMERSQISIGASIRELPMGIRQNTDPDSIGLILPLSARPSDIDHADVMVSVTDYDAFLSFLQGEEYAFSDYLEGQMQYRNYVTMIRIFSYGFIALISLICICNVFNTISTNIALRKKDFGMLRSVGMKNRELNRMMAFECLQYGLRALLYGVPLSLAFSFWISRIVTADYAVPVQAMAIAAGCIFATVFITMLYAVSKLRRQNPMEAIRSGE